VPAVISDPTPEGRAELRRVIRGALHGATVTIADDALTETSLLTIERRPPRDLEGEASTGRELGRPLQFLLVLRGSQCFLLRQPDGERFELSSATCQPE
jgi:hypothetical protein